VNCPKCNTPLVKKYYKGSFEVDACPSCQGMWLDFDELDQLEDFAFDADAFKGSLVHWNHPTGFHCPHCDEPLEEFQYRLYSLKLDFCAANMHGFWLDYGEDQRVIEIMQKRKDDIERKLEADQEWQDTLRKLRSKSFFDQLRNMFK
jgi:Zn-finger nucleic acid-binding protein